MDKNEIKESTESLINFLDKKAEWLGWRIATEISSADTSSILHELSQEISKTNLTLNKINDNLKKIAEKE